MNATTWTSWPNWFWNPAAIHCPFAPLGGMPRMRTNMKPEVITSEVSTMPAAQTHRERRTGRKARMPDAIMRSTPTVVPMRGQLIGVLYGIGTGVNWESCSASGPASKPLTGGKL